MPVSEVESCANVRMLDRKDAKRKPDPTDVRIVFAGRISDKWRAEMPMAQTIESVIENMRSLGICPAGTTRTLCQKQIARLVKAGDEDGRASFIACLSEARRVGIVPVWLDKWDGLPKALRCIESQIPHPEKLPAIPTARIDGKPVFEVRKTGNGTQVEFNCPLCREPHYHGWPDSEPLGVPSHRAAHCNPKRSYLQGGYYIALPKDGVR